MYNRQDFKQRLTLGNVLLGCMAFVVLMFMFMTPYTLVKLGLTFVFIVALVLWGVFNLAMVVLRMHEALQKP
ncbi:hypothetical protein [Desertibacillus haloalkaliphilus]|uniref:hypothetical protein n=1 Tax=Desertibacillus haloalkaliphilus TaxID=1328930 RepID=UPI001C267EB8|nr:hypothetical protein [Desertibacillus haloalkaliphilus]MBU8908160.1 hypothetical protein [Desertibacillus haloalkaliphilus]